MFYRQFLSSGLRAHALAISFGLIALTGLLGVRAYLIARGHLHESRILLEREVPVQNLLYQLETSQTALAQAGKKLKITADPVYAQLVFKYTAVIEKSKQELKQIWPELAPAIDEGAPLPVLLEKVASEREARVRHSRDTAAGLLRLILIAVAMSFLLTAWLIALLYKGLMEPLETLNAATHRIRSGDLACRIKSDGVAELRDLGRSFNAMAERLESLDQAKRDFLAMISHEIKNPMAALKEGLALLTSPNKELSADSQKRCISACQIASKRLEYMINNLLSLSRSETGMFKFEVTQQNLDVAIQHSVTEVRPIADKKNIQIRVNCPENFRVAINQEAMVQALVNLLLNAIKYGSENSVIDVAVRVLEDSRRPVELTVTNFGKEISSSELSKVFERFYRGQNSSRQQGMGIGLHVVKQVVEAHHGAVSALSTAGRTQMILNLPARMAGGEI